MNDESRSANENECGRGLGEDDRPFNDVDKSQTVDPMSASALKGSG